MAEHWRIPLDRKFRCILPGHAPDLHASAALHKHVKTDGVWRYMDFHRNADPDSLTLAEVAASLATGRIVQLRGPSQARWYRRLFYEVGILELDVRPLVTQLQWEGLSEKAQTFAKGYMLLEAIRSHDDDPVPLAASFMGPWCGLTRVQSREALNELRRREFLRRTGMHQRLFLYERGREAA